MPPEESYRARRSRLPLLLSSLFALLIASCVLIGIGLQSGVLRPPPFSVMIVTTEFSAPCPRNGFQCDADVRYYAIWRGDPQPNGSIRYRLLYFTYLPKAQ
ncbi:hypothetical protein HC891_19045 [Candidatus Gracilibacteria bacterium]|nr:hypothetical protein [Candidatus Gracilibacteria bacterium]